MTKHFERNRVQSRCGWSHNLLDICVAVMAALQPLAPLMVVGAAVDRDDAHDSSLAA